MRPHRSIPRAIQASMVALAFALLAVGGGWMTGAFTARAQDATGFVIGQAVVVNTDGLALRSDAGTAFDAIEILPQGAYLEILDGPVDDGEYRWYLVAFDEISGYVAGEFLAAAASTGAFAIGDIVTVVTDALNLRKDATLAGGTTDVLGFGVAATVLDGPVDADGYALYQLDVAGVTGWAVRDYLAYGALGTGTVEGGEAVGTALLVNTDTLNVRDIAGLSGTVLETLAAGDSVTATGITGVVDGYNWSEVQTATGTVGWVVSDYLTSDADALLLTVGAVGSVDTEALSLRDAPGLAGTMLGTLVPGDAVTIISASEAADGYLWYQVETATGTGWVAGIYLAI